MSLKDRTYSVLIVSSSEKFNQALSELFFVPTFSPVNIVTNVSIAKRSIVERDYDFLILNPLQSDETFMRFAIDTINNYNIVVLYVTRADQYAENYDTLAAHGIFLIQKPISKSILQTAVDWMISARERIRKNEKKALSIEEKMNEIRLVNRAKWLLISNNQMTEPDAHRYIEKRAMDFCTSKSDIANEIIRNNGKI